MSFTRRYFLGAGGALVLAAGFLGLRSNGWLGHGAGLGLGGLGLGLTPAKAAEPEKFPYTLSDAQWRKQLTDEQYAILREQGTERPFTSPLNDEHRTGTFSCAGCRLSLYSSKTKYDSHTGWPSFWQPLDHAVETSRDTSFGMERDEVHCVRCGGHLGHVFNDGPRPTGLRYCMNGLAMTFTPT